MSCDSNYSNLSLQGKVSLCRAIAKHREPIVGLDVDADRGDEGEPSFADALVDAVSFAWRARHPARLEDDPGFVLGDGPTVLEMDEPWPDDDLALPFRELREIDAQLRRHFGRSIRVDAEDEARLYGDVR